jgi:hypothetical protein
MFDRAAGSEISVAVDPLFPANDCCPRWTTHYKIIAGAEINFEEETLLFSSETAIQPWDSAPSSCNQSVEMHKQCKSLFWLWELSLSASRMYPLKNGAYNHWLCKSMVCKMVLVAK